MFKYYLYLIAFFIVLFHIIVLLNSTADLYKNRKKKWLICYILLACLLLCANYLESLYPLDYMIGSDEDHYKFHWSEHPPKGDIYKVKISLSGFDTCWEYTAPKDMVIEMTYSLSVYTGKAKLVLVSPFKQVSTLAENITQTTEEPLRKIQVHLKEGKNKIKLVTSSRTELFLQINIEEGTFIKLGV